MTAMGASVLPLAISVELGHALIQSVADQIGVRVLFIKGPIANKYKLRPFRQSGDVDVLVEMGRAHELISAMQEFDWVVRPASLANRTFVTHSDSLIHHSWPCDIDVHLSYPGMFSDEAFEALWARRTTTIFAGREVDSVDYVSSALIAALHSLRTPFDTRSALELNHLVEAWTVVQTPSLEHQLVELAKEVGGLWAVQPFFDAVGIRAQASDEPPVEYGVWLRNQRQLNRSAAWISHIASARWRERPGLIAKAMFPARTDIYIDHPAGREGALAFTRAWWKRLTTAARALPVAVAAFRQERALKMGRPTQLVGFAAPSPKHMPLLQDQPMPQAKERALEEQGKSVSVLPLFSTADSVSASEVTSRRAIPSASLIWVEDGDRTFILDAARGSNVVTPLLLEGTAKEIWGKIQEGITVDAIALAFSKQYAQEYSALREQVLAFIDQLRSMNLLRFTESDSLRS